jgi:hypothetical protein
MLAGGAGDAALAVRAGGVQVLGACVCNGTMALFIGSRLGPWEQRPRQAQNGMQLLTLTTDAKDNIMTPMVGVASFAEAYSRVAQSVRHGVLGASSCVCSGLMGRVTDTS